MEFYIELNRLKITLCKMFKNKRESNRCQQLPTIFIFPIDTLPSCFFCPSIVSLRSYFLYTHSPLLLILSLHSFSPFILSFYPSIFSIHLIYSLILFSFSIHPFSTSMLLSLYKHPVFSCILPIHAFSLCLYCLYTPVHFFLIFNSFIFTSILLFF